MVHHSEYWGVNQYQGVDIAVVHPRCFGTANYGDCSSHRDSLLFAFTIIILFSGE